MGKNTKPDDPPPLEPKPRPFLLLAERDLRTSQPASATIGGAAPATAEPTPNFDPWATIVALQQRLAELNTQQQSQSMELATLRAEHTEVKTEQTEVWNELAYVKTEHAKLKGELRALEVRSADPAKEIASFEVTVPVPSGGIGDTGGRPDSRRTREKRSSLIANAMKMVDDANELEECELGDSMWDACLFIGCPSAGVGRLVTLWALFVFVLNGLLQTTFVAIVVLRMADNPDIGPDTAGDLRSASRSGSGRALAAKACGCFYVLAGSTA
jgi:hypothetical protein